MKSNKALLSFFPTRLYHTSLPKGLLRLPSGLVLPKSPIFLAQLLKETVQFEKMDLPGARWSKKNYLGGYTSYSSQNQIHQISAQFDMLKQWIDIQVKNYVRDLQWDISSSALFMSSFWINRMSKGCHHSFHLHPLSVISGTFYLKVPNGSGAFKIEDPRLMALMGTPMKKTGKGVEGRHVEIKTKPGELLLFESWLKHEVPANHSNQDRVSVSFNYDWDRNSQ